SGGFLQSVWEKGWLWGGSISVRQTSSTPAGSLRLGAKPQATSLPEGGINEAFCKATILGGFRESGPVAKWECCNRPVALYLNRREYQKHCRGRTSSYALPSPSAAPGW